MMNSYFKQLIHTSWRVKGAHDTQVQWPEFFPKDEMNFGSRNAYSAQIPINQDGWLYLLH